MITIKKMVGLFTSAISIGLIGYGGYSLYKKYEKNHMNKDIEEMMMLIKKDMNKLMNK